MLVLSASVWLTDRKTPGFSNPSTFSRMRPKPLKRSEFSSPERSGFVSLTNSGSSSASPAMKSGSMVKLFYAG